MEKIDQILIYILYGIIVILVILGIIFNRINKNQE